MIICLFDIDGTLLSSQGAGKAALESAFTQAFGVPVTTHVPYSGRTDRAIARDLLQTHGIEYNLANFHRLRDGYLANLPLYLERHQGRVLPGINQLLETLARREDVILGLLTGNVRAGAKAKLGHYGLFERFRLGGFGDEHYDRDDVAREAFRAVQQSVAADHPADRVWVIGDTPLDVQCARAIGARAVAVATGAYSVEELCATRPDLALADFSDPGPFFEGMATRCPARPL